MWIAKQVLIFMVPLSSRNPVGFHFLTDGLPLFIVGGTPLSCSAVSRECGGGMNECRNLGQSMEDLLTHFCIQSSTFFGGTKQTVGRHPKYPHLHQKGYFLFHYQQFQSPVVASLECFLMIMHFGLDIISSLSHLF